MTYQPTTRVLSNILENHSCSTKAKLGWKDSGLFDVAMGAFDRAEVRKLFSNLLLLKLSEKYERKSLALYRDDGLLIFKNASRPDSGKIKKTYL